MRRLPCILLSALHAGAPVLLARTACEIFPIEDAVVVLSQNAEQRDSGDAGCAYEIRTPYLLLKVTPPEDTAKSGYAAIKQTAREHGAQVRDEPTIGSASFSIVTKEAEQIYVIHGATAFTIALSNPGSSTPLPDLMGKMRDVARRAVARL